MRNLGSRVISRRAGGNAGLRMTEFITLDDLLAACRCSPKPNEIEWHLK